MDLPDSNQTFVDEVFDRDNKHLAPRCISIKSLYPDGANQPLLPETFSREQFGQGNHYECFMLSALATLVNYPEIIRNCFITKNVRQDGRYIFQFFRGKEWVKVEIDDRIPMEEEEVLYIQSPTEHWWPLLLEKAYAKFYTAYDHLEGCTLQETYHDLTGLPVLNIPMDPKLARAANCIVTEGAFWLDLAQKVSTGRFVASVLTKDIDIESMGLQRDQQYGVLDVFTLTGTSSVNDIVIRLHNPFEDDEYVYTGPLNAQDGTWTAKMRAKHDVDDPRSIFLPLNTFLKIMNSLQLCYITHLTSDATFFDDEWTGETAGGNPTSVLWRKNPIYLMRNTGSTPSDIVVVIKQDDQRRFTPTDEVTKYLQCGLVLVNYVYPNPIVTRFITGNNHKPIHKSLFLNSRDVANAMTIPPNSLCYLVPSCMFTSAEGPFTLAIYRFMDTDYSELTIEKLSIPDMNWADPASRGVALRELEKDRVDFYADEETDIHILLHQDKPFISKSGGDAMTEDYMGMYLYDDRDHKIGGVHAATNFREVSIIHHLPRSGRYAISVTCPRGNGDVLGYVNVVGSHQSHIRVVDPPADATMFDDDDEIIEEGEGDAEILNVIDFYPNTGAENDIAEVPDSNIPFEDQRFMVNNKNITAEPWVHIGDLYPEGKNKPLLPDVLSRKQFVQGEHFECCALTGFAALVDHHPDVIRNCFVSKTPRKDGRYTFQFHRYGQWMKVEIDDRIPMMEGNTLYCRSPTGHWWPLLLEKAYAKFYTLYQNVEGCSQQEVLHDFSGRPVVSIPCEAELTLSATYDIKDPLFWMELNEELKTTAIAALTQNNKAETFGLQDDQSYAVVGFVPMHTGSNINLSEILVMMYNPFEEIRYTGPMNASDPSWPPELRSLCFPENNNIFFMPVDVFCRTFLNMHQAYLKGPLASCWNFNSEWGTGTSGGNPTLVTWRENPIYVVQNRNEEPLQILAMIRQPDKRHLLHRQTNQDLNYIQCGLILTESTSPERIPTYLITGNHHRTVHKGLFLNTREVANLVTVPASSMCYLVPSAMLQDTGKFILSYWYLFPDDHQSLSIERLNPRVARHLPAIDHMELRTHERHRTDFIIDVPTEVHILLRQEKVFKTANGGDAMAEDFLAMYLYDPNEQRINGTRSATNYREIGLVHRLTTPGQYAVSVNCLQGNGNVPCRVEIVTLESAHVRVADLPEHPCDLGEVNLAFLVQMPEGVPLDDVPLENDPHFQKQLDALRELHNDPQVDLEEIAHLEKLLNDRAHELAKYVIGKDRHKYLPNINLERLNPVLNEDTNYMEAEKDRYALKKNPRNTMKVVVVEQNLRTIAEEIEQSGSAMDLGFLDPEYEGIPTEDINPIRDSQFLIMGQKRTKLLENSITNAMAIDTVENDMHNLCRELADSMHRVERAYLDSEPACIPLNVLPLNEDDEFSRLEDELRTLLNRRPAPKKESVQALQKQANERAHVLAKDLKDRERELFLDPAPNRVPIADLPLDTDAEFHSKEVERLRLRKEDPLANGGMIHEMEKCLNARAKEVADCLCAELRRFLDPAPLGIPLVELGIVYDDQFNALEDQLRALMGNPKRNAMPISIVEDSMRARVNELAAVAAALDRQFLDPEPEGRLLQDLGLDDNSQFIHLTKLRREARNAGDVDRMADLEEQMNDMTHDIAHQLNVGERPQLLAPTYRGIDYRDMPLDEDPDFRTIEARRQVLKRDSTRNADAIAETERELEARAMELVLEILAGDRDFLDAEPVGVPLCMLPLNTDPVFSKLETERAKLKKDPRRSAMAIAKAEGEMNARVYELSRKLKGTERARFLESTPNDIPVEELPLDTDQPFRDMEIQRLLLKEDPQRNATAIQELEDSLHDRALELATELKNATRAMLNPEVLRMEVADLHLDSHPDYLTKEQQLRAQLRDPHCNSQAVKAVQDELLAMAQAIAADEIAKTRGLLDPEPEGRLLENLPLDDDAEFASLEKEHRALQKDPKRNAQALADIEEMMNERVHAIAQALNATERLSFLPSTLRCVLLEEIPLDADSEFTQLEADRQRFKRQPAKNRKVIQEVEDALRRRAEELSQEKIQADRYFIDPEPEGVPVKYVPLDEDPAFRAMETERMTLKNQNVGNQDPRIQQLEMDLNARTHEVARATKQKLRESVLPDSMVGIPREALPLEEDMPFADLEVALIRARGDGEDPQKAQNLADAMSKRAADVAYKMREEERARLEPQMGFSPSELPLESNKQYMDCEADLVVLRTNPNKNAEKITKVERDLNRMLLQMAKVKAADERGFLDPEPEGRLVKQLDLDDDPTFRGLEDQYRRAKKDPYADQDRLGDLEQMMNDRTHEIARAFNAAERARFMDQAPHHVPLSELPLDTDEVFLQLEADRAKLCQDPKKNAAAIRHVEDALNDRGDQLAEEAIRNDRMYLEDAPSHVQIRQVPFEQNPEFCRLEELRTALKNSDPVQNAAAISQLEDQLNALVRELAEKVKEDNRADMESTIVGIPRQQLDMSLDEDAHFLGLEERYRDAKVGPARGSTAAQLLQQMNERAAEIVQGIHDTERQALDPTTDGIPLSALPLNEDPIYLGLENDARAIRFADPSDPALQSLEDQMNERARDLANVVRKGYCAAEPNGVPLAATNMGDDPNVRAMEKDLFRLCNNPVANRTRIRELQEKLNTKAHEKAMDILRSDRNYLNHNPEGVALRNLPLDTDEKFHGLEVERSHFKNEDSTGNANTIQKLEDAMNARAVELANALKFSELRALDKDPMGLTLAAIGPHKDEQFAAMAADLRDLKADPRRNAEAIRDMHDRMNMRTAELASAILRGDRGFLDSLPAGVPLEILPVDSDAKFHKLQVDRARLKSTPSRGGDEQRIRALEDMMNERIRELAEDQKADDLRGLNQKPLGILIGLVRPHDDQRFAAYLPELRELKRNPRELSDRFDELLRAMDDRCEELAAQMLRDDRPQYLRPDPKGVPLGLLPLDKDPQFNQMEVERAMLKAKDPQRNSKRLTDLEQRLSARTEELADQQLRQDFECLQALPGGLSFSAVDLMGDSEFAENVTLRRELAKDPDTNAMALAEVEEAMNNRAQELTKALLRGDRGFLDPAPQTVPLKYLPVDEDAAFRQMEGERAKLKAQDPRRNARQIKDLESRLSDRADELAREIQEAELRQMNQILHVLPLAVLKPHRDHQFQVLANHLREVRANGGSYEDEASIFGAMNARALELAKSAADREYLDQNPEGVLLDVVPLDTDTIFHKMEVDRAKLKLKDPRRNHREITALEAKLNNRARELARKQIQDDLSACDVAPHGIPLELLKPMEDPVFANMVPQLRELKKDPVANASAIAEVEQQMADRALELADTKLKGDRAYLNSSPGGVPLEFLPLEKDDKFHSMEVDRAKLIAQDPRRNMRQIQDLERALNYRVQALAEEKKRDEIAMFPPTVEGVETAALRPHEDNGFADMVAQLRDLQGDGELDTPAGKKLMEEMRERLHDLAKERTEGDLWFLEKNPEGLPVTEIGLAHDPVFDEMRSERARLKASDPRRNADKIRSLEDKMNERVKDLARVVFEGDFDGVDPMSLGIPLEMLHPRDDPLIARLLPELRRAKDSGPSEKVQGLLGTIDGRVRDLAHKALTGDRATYVDEKPNGVDLKFLPLETDKIFQGLEAERARLKLEDPIRNAKQMEDVEDRLNRRAYELADDVLAEDLQNLDQEPEGLPLSTVMPFNNPDFAGLAELARQLRSDPHRNADMLTNVEVRMNTLTQEMAREMIDNDRAFLDPCPEGVPLSVLPLDEDAEFKEMEVQRIIMKAQSPVRKDMIVDLEDRLNDRVLELAVQQKRADFEGLESVPRGVPVALLNPHDDPKLADLLPELRLLKQGVPSHRGSLSDLQRTLNKLLDELAQEYLARDRTAYLHPASGGIPFECIPLDADESFKTLENERYELIVRDPRANKDLIEELEASLNERVRFLAKEACRQDRGYLSTHPEGIPLSVLKLDDDRQFTELEARRAALKASGPVRNAGTIHDLEDQLNDRVTELACEQKAEDLRSVDQCPEGIPVELLGVHNDPEFARMLDALRLLDAYSQHESSTIRTLEAEMSDRVRELADVALRDDRPLYLGAEVEGLAVDRLRLDTDPRYHTMEVERAILKLEDLKLNAGKIADLEDRLADRAMELAREILEADVADLNVYPFGVPISILQPHRDAVFHALADRRRSGEHLAPDEDIVGMLNERIETLAHDLLAEARPSYLDPSPEGIPLSGLPLDTDPEFHDLEVMRAILRVEDSTSNEDKIANLNERLSARAHELAREALSGDRDYLDSKPAGVPLGDLPLNEDHLFHQMEVDRAKLKTDPNRNAAKITQLEERLNDRAHKLADKQLKEDLEGLDAAPCGIPFASLNLHSDPTFASFLPELRNLKKDSSRNTPRTLDILAQMNLRAEELAKENIARERAFLDPDPEGVPLAQLPLNTDKAFQHLEKALRRTDPHRQADQFADLQERMNARVHELAREVIEGDRKFLSPVVEGIPIAEVQIDDDREFRELEVKRAKLKEDPSKNMEAIGAIEKQLKDRSHKLGAVLKEMNRKFLNPTSHDISSWLLPLDQDTVFQKMEQQLRRLQQDPRRNAPAIQSLQEMMQQRADELGEMILKGNRDKYLDATPEGIPLSDLPLNTDPAFHEWEVSRALLRSRDPLANAVEIAALEANLSARAHELAREIKVECRSFLPPDLEYIPIDEVPLDKDPTFVRQEEFLRKLKKDPRRNGGGAIQDMQDKITERALELARGVASSDLACLPEKKYRGIPREDLDLHSFPQFSDVANRRRQVIRDGAVPGTVAAIVAAMDAVTREIADAVIRDERGFLDKEPEGMALADLPLDSDPTFTALEEERRKRSKDPRTVKRNKNIIRDLEGKMTDRVHELAKEEFAKHRREMIQEPEGVPLRKLPLDTDNDFKEAEIVRYKLLKEASPNREKLAELLQRMNDQAHKLAETAIAKDHGFLNTEPEGVPLSKLNPEADPVFSALAKERQALKNASRRDPEKMKTVEEQMNNRVQELACKYLDENRDFINPSPQNVPLADIPLNRDLVFRDMERELDSARKDPVENAHPIAQLQDDLNKRAEELAHDLLRKERAMQDQEPLGVPLRELPLNFDPILNQLEARRRFLKKDPRRNADSLRDIESDIADRVRQIAKDLLDKERAFLDQKPEGVPLWRLPLNEDRDFHEMETDLRDFKKTASKNKDLIEDLEERMNNYVRDLAKAQLTKERAFLDREPGGVPLEDLPLSEDPTFLAMEEEHRKLKAEDPRGRAKTIHELEKRLNEQAGHIAQEVLAKERAFLPQSLQGLPLKDLPLVSDKQFQIMEKELRQLRRDPSRNASKIVEVEAAMVARVNTLAGRKLADDRAYLNPEPLGVPIADLNLSKDDEFRELELRRRTLKKQPSHFGEVKELEEHLNKAANRIASAFLKKERAFLDQEPEGVPLEELPLNSDPEFHGLEMDRRKLRKDSVKNAEAIKVIEEHLNLRAHGLAIEKKGYQDTSFHTANEAVSEMWPRIRELYPEGVYDPITPDTTLPSDVSSASQDMGFLAPFIAALARHTVLITRLFQDRAHLQNQPYRITLFNPDGSPTTVEVDDRVPCDEKLNPKFTQVPSRVWYPLLLEKAYAKFVGGYENFNNCNAHDTLRDLTGRPVLHISLEDPKHAAATNMGDYTGADYWRRVLSDLNRGDVYICVAKSEAPDGIHSLCCYALMDVIEVKQDTSDPNEIVIKLHNCYRDEPGYSGPLHVNDCAWTSEMRRICDYQEGMDVLYLPLLTFLANFSCMQRCHINCGDRLSSPGEWNEYTAGGTSKFTTFRSNPIYLVENRTSRRAAILAEVRHVGPLFVDESNCMRYPYTGLTLMQPIDPKLPPTPFITSGTHKSLQKGMMLDSREVCMEMVLPPSSTCYLIPFTKDRATPGKFNVSIYPDMATVTLTPLRHAGLTLKPLSKVVHVSPNATEGLRVDFALNDACDTHILLHQSSVPESGQRGDAIGEDELTMSVFNEYGIRVGTTGDPSNAREHALVFKAPQQGRYSLLVICSSSASDAPCEATLNIFTPRGVEADFLEIPLDARPLALHSANSRFPALCRMATAPLRHASREAHSSNRRRIDSMPATPHQHSSASNHSANGVPPASYRRSRSGRR